MLFIQYRSILQALVIAPLALGCASASLKVPEGGAANPQAESMPVSNNTAALREDFDPFAESNNAAMDPHAHHHSGHDSGSAAEPAAGSDSTVEKPQHRHHEHVSESAPSPTPTPKSKPASPTDAAQGGAHDHE